MSLALSTCLLLISLMQLTNRAQSLNATPLSLSPACLATALCTAPVIVIFPLSLSSACLAAELSTAPVIVIFPLSRIYASL